ncbi:MAG: 50S ribosomal protein L29 [Patescibacteria group bacterium]
MKSIEKLKNYREMSIEKLLTELIVLEKKLSGDNLRVKAGKLDNYSEITKVRKDIARVKTIISEKSLEI